MNAAVLAGGKGSRMNYKDKSRLVYRDRTFLDTIVSRLTDFERIMVISNRDKSEYGSIEADFHKDLIKDIGPLGGIYTALERSGSHHVFITTCDMPLITRENIRNICSHSDCDIVIPEFEGKYEMLFALYSRNCLPRINEMLEAKRYKITGLFDDKNLIVKKIPVDRDFISTLKNINTIEDHNKLTNTTEGLSTAFSN